MIRVKITDDTIIVTGHAEYAERGEDIVCAGVSTLMQTMVLGLEAIAKGYPSHMRIEVDDQRTHSNPTPPKEDHLWAHDGDVEALARCIYSERVCIDDKMIVTRTGPPL